MKTIILAIKNLITQGKEALDENQKKSLGFLLKFFSVMILFTILAKGTAAATLPVIESKKPTSATISNLIEASGVVKAEDISVIKVPNGVRIEKALVQPGVDIKEGDPVLQYSKEEIDQALKLANVNLREIEINIQEQLYKDSKDSSSTVISQKELKWEKEDLEQSKKESNVTLSRYEQDYTEELEKLSALRTKKRKEKLELGYSGSNGSDDFESEYKELIKAAEKSVETSRRAYYDAQIAAGKTIEQAERSILKAEILTEAAEVKKQDEAVKSSIDSAKSFNAAEKLKLDLEKQKDLIEMLKKIIADEYKLSSNTGGKIVEILMLDGIIPSGSGQTSDYIKLSRKNSSVYAEIELSEKDAKSVKVGNTVNIIDDKYSEKAKVRSVALPNNDKKIVVTITLDEKNWAIGNSLTVKIPISEKKHKFTVPLSAVYEDNQGAYIYVVYEDEGILGVQNKVVSQRVTLDEKDKQNAAISGSLYGDEQIVVSSTKPLNNFDTVRTK